MQNQMYNSIYRIRNLGYIRNNLWQKIDKKLTSTKWIENENVYWINLTVLLVCSPYLVLIDQLNTADELDKWAQKDASDGMLESEFER